MPKELVYYDSSSNSFKSTPYSSSSGTSNDNTAVSVTELNKKAPKPIEKTATLTAAGWSAGSIPPYTQVLSVTGITSASKGEIGVPQSATSDQYKAAIAAMLRPSAQGTNTITVTAEGSKPSIDIPVIIVITE